MPENDPTSHLHNSITSIDAALQAIRAALENFKGPRDPLARAADDSNQHEAMQGLALWDDGILKIDEAQQQAEAAKQTITEMLGRMGISGEPSAGPAVLPTAGGSERNRPLPEPSESPDATADEAGQPSDEIHDVTPDEAENSRNDQPEQSDYDHTIDRVDYITRLVDGGTRPSQIEECVSNTNILVYDFGDDILIKMDFPPPPMESPLGPVVHPYDIDEEDYIPPIQTSAIEDTVLPALLAQQGVEGAEQIAAYIPADDTHDAAVGVKRADGKRIDGLRDDEINNIAVEHYDKLLNTYEELIARGVAPDTHDQNIFYDSEKGFTVIDNAMANAPYQVSDHAVQFVGPSALSSRWHNGQRFPQQAETFITAYRQRYGDEATARLIVKANGHYEDFPSFRQEQFRIPEDI